MNMGPEIRSLHRAAQAIRTGRVVAATADGIDEIAMADLVDSATDNLAREVEAARMERDEIRIERDKLKTLAGNFSAALAEIERLRAALEGK